jgi:hypothetical protein
MDFICADVDLQRAMLTDLAHPSHLLAVNLLIVAAELAGAALVAAIMLAVRRVSPLAAALRSRTAAAGPALAVHGPPGPARRQG